MKWNSSYCILAAGTSIRKVQMKKVKSHLKDYKSWGGEEAVGADQEDEEWGSCPHWLTSLHAEGDQYILSTKAGRDQF